MARLVALALLNTRNVMTAKRISATILLAFLASGFTQSVRQSDMSAPTGLSVKRYFTEAEPRELASAVCQGDKRTIEKYSGRKNILNMVGDQGMTPLLWGVLCQNPSGVEAVIAAGADPNQVISYKKLRTTPLLEACERGNVDVVRKLLSGGADVNFAPSDKDVAYVTPIIAAIHNGMDTRSFDIFDLVLARGADLELATSFGYPIEYLARVNPALVEQIVDRGYSFRLYPLALVVQLEPVPNLKIDEWRLGAEKLWKKLASRGVELPVTYRNSGYSEDRWPINAKTGLADGDAIVVGGGKARFGASPEGYWIPTPQ
ncbi:ankyrin repeat domain-containing protein [Aquidulcibacter sp.]|uniref:ankyrin repeat domain-containing protein n=1 Tax=Aquidulcibacter sp. TaxID=2052990 RepID=UPI0025BB4891|nr:ankyrin repeat domain-containing protein [Aquidulcibacter sp.]MCA3697479.1 ankyrin repeat domain-containing protein [Aquidulcibacter sp.]